MCLFALMCDTFVHTVTTQSRGGWGPACCAVHQVQEVGLALLLFPGELCLVGGSVLNQTDLSAIFTCTHRHEQRLFE